MKCGKGRLLLMGFILLAALASLEVEAGDLRMEEVAKDLTCQCGCNKVLSVCEMQGWAVPAKELIQEKIDGGLSKEEIVAYFVEQYGHKILAAPPKEGFNLTAWVVPFVLMGVGATLIVFLLKVWVKRQLVHGDEERLPLEGMTAEEASRYKKELETELRSWKY
ncbi:MAG: cytochrome c-type biogenesis protein CcmH [Candidatus Binatia bacterium]